MLFLQAGGMLASGNLTDNVVGISPLAQHSLECSAFHFKLIYQDNLPSRV
jgi:hypothetical protein